MLINLKKIFIFLIVCTQSQAVYIRGGENLEVGGITTPKKFPFICQIVREREGDKGTGTGSFVSPNIILTCSHVVGSKGEENTLKEVSTEDLKIRTYKSLIKYELHPVQKILFYNEVESYKNLALLILDKNVEGIMPVEIEAYNSEKLPKKITAVGYGKGETISNQCEEGDIIQSIGSMLGDPINFLRFGTVKVDGTTEKFEKNFRTLFDEIGGNINLETEKKPKIIDGAVPDN